MPDDFSLMHTWDIVEQLQSDVAGEIRETDHGLDFVNIFGDVVFTVYIAGTE